MNLKTLAKQDFKTTIKYNISHARNEDKDDRWVGMINVVGKVDVKVEKKN